MSRAKLEERLREKVLPFALQLLSEGLITGEESGDWTILMSDEDDTDVLIMSLSDAAKLVDQ